MNILLGIFEGPHFGKVLSIENVSTYPFTELIGDYWSEIDSNDIIIDTVSHACLVCDKIIFLIDRIRPITTSAPQSITCQELLTLLSSTISKSKIEFREDNNVVSYDYVVDKLNLFKELG